jgi:hypothetical protein
MNEQFSLPDDSGPLKMSDIRTLEAAQAARDYKAYVVTAESCLGVLCAVVLIIGARRLLRRLPKARPVSMPDP